MWQLKAFFLFLTSSYLAESRSPPEVHRPFNVPGEIIYGLRVEDIMETLGGVWNAESLRDGAELVCEEFKTVLTFFIQELTREPGTIERICDVVRTSEIEEFCNNIWDQAVSRRFDEDASISLVPGLECREDNNYDYPGGGFWESSASEGPNLNFTNYNDWYPTMVEAEHEAMTEVKQVYDFCSGQGIEKINNILFALADWLGPSVFNIVYYDQYSSSPYSICSIERYIMSLSPETYTEEAIKIAKFPLADILEYLRHLDICDKSADNIGIELVKDILVEFSGLNGDDFCEFISEGHTREEYLDKAHTIIVNALHVFFEEQRCNNFLSILAPLDKESVHVKFIGFNLTVPSERFDFCQQVIDAFSPTSTFEPSPYRLPSDFDIRNWEPFSTPGEFLPGLTLIDLLEIEGATWRAETIIEGVGIYCTVFEESVGQIVEQETFDIASLCDLVKSGNLEALEGKCQALLFPSYFDRPIGVKPFNPIPVAVYLARDLTGISDISKDELCPAANNLFNDRSLQDIVLRGLEVFIAESLPSLLSVCQNWEEIVCYWKPYCPEPDFDISEPATATEDPFYRFYRYTPTQEEVKKGNAEFDEILSGLESLVLITVNYEDRETFCNIVAASGIDPVSGRAVSEFVEELRDNSYGLLTDVQRCSGFVDTILGLIPDRDVEEIFTGGNTNLLYQVTGFSTSHAFCEALADDFSAGTGSSTPAGPTGSGKPAVTYNVFVKIAIYLQENGQFPFPF